jgi:hypothetical protein
MGHSGNQGRRGIARAWTAIGHACLWFLFWPLLLALRLHRHQTNAANRRRLS